MQHPELLARQRREGRQGRQQLLDLARWAAAAVRLAYLVECLRRGPQSRYPGEDGLGRDRPRNRKRPMGNLDTNAVKKLKGRRPAVEPETFETGQAQEQSAGSFHGHCRCRSSAAVQQTKLAENASWSDFRDIDGLISRNARIDARASPRYEIHAIGNIVLPEQYSVGFELKKTCGRLYFGERCLREAIQQRDVSQQLVNVLGLFWPPLHD